MLYEPLRELRVSGNDLLVTVKINTPFPDNFELIVIRPTSLQVWYTKTTVSSLRPLNSVIPAETFGVMLCEALHGTAEYTFDAAEPNPDLTLIIRASIQPTGSSVPGAGGGTTASNSAPQSYTVTGGGNATIAKVLIAHIVVASVVSPGPIITQVLRGAVVHMDELTTNYRRAAAEATKLPEALRQRDDALRMKLVSESTMLRGFQRILNEKKRKLCEIEEEREAAVKERDRLLEQLARRGPAGTQNDHPGGELFDDDDDGDDSSHGSRKDFDDDDAKPGDEGKGDPDTAGEGAPRGSLEALMGIGRQISM